MSQNAAVPGNRADCCAKLTISSPEVAETTASTHCTYSRRDGQAECAQVAWISLKK